MTRSSTDGVHAHSVTFGCPMKTKRNRKRSDNSVLYSIGNETYSDGGFPLRSVLMAERNVTVTARMVTFCFGIEAQRNGVFRRLRPFGAGIPRACIRPAVKGAVRCGSVVRIRRTRSGERAPLRVRYKCEVVTALPRKFLSRSAPTRCGCAGTTGTVPAPARGPARCWS